MIAVGARRRWSAARGAAEQVLIKAARPVAILGLCLAPSLSKAATATVVCTAIEEASTGTLLKRDGDCERRVTPASTFKIAISLMGFDAGFLKDEHTPLLPFHQGYPDWLPAWRQATDPTSWIANSVVWYSQQVTASLGDERFSRYALAFHYGNADVSGDPGKHNGLSRAWLSSSLAISPLEQLAFLRRLVERQLPVTPAALTMTSRVTALGSVSDGWALHGKTGTGAPSKADGSADPDHAYGWFVGWATKGSRTVVFARLIQDNGPDPISAGLRARDALVRDLPSTLNTL